jgi:IS4 transposase
LQKFFSDAGKNKVSRYSNLPIYNSAVNCLKDLYKRIPKFDKQYKYLLGGKLVEYNTKIITLIFEISNSRDSAQRSDLCSEILKNADLMMIHARICNDLKQFGKEESYLYVSENLVNISDQAEKWKKHLDNN